jgi:hypothetical protein
MTVSLWSKKSDTLWNRVFVCFINRITSESLYWKNRPDRLGIESWLKRFLEATQATPTDTSRNISVFYVSLSLSKRHKRHNKDSNGREGGQRPCLNAQPLVGNWSTCASSNGCGRRVAASAGRKASIEGSARSRLDVCGSIHQPD